MRAGDVTATPFSIIGGVMLPRNNAVGGKCAGPLSRRRPAAAERARVLHRVLLREMRGVFSGGVGANHA